MPARDLPLSEPCSLEGGHWLQCLPPTEAQFRLLYLLRGIAIAEEGNIAVNIAPGDTTQAASLAALGSQKFKDAEADYRKALSLLENGTKNGGLHYVLLVNRGLIRLKQRELTAATADLQEAIRENDRGFEAHMPWARSTSG